jgi:hypothetical protein
VKGDATHDREKVSISYIGLAENKNYLARHLFPGGFTERRLNLINLTDSLVPSKRCTIKVIEGLSLFEKLYRWRGYIYIPGWVKGTIELPEEFSHLKRNRSLNSDLNRIHNNRYEYFETHELKWFHTFYYEMFVPLIKSRHGNCGFVNSYYEMRRLFEKSVLLIINRDSEPVAGCIVSVKGTRGCLWMLGVKSGDVGHIQNGVMSAIYYYSIKFLHERGCRTITVGMSRALLDDGVLTYKKKWGMKITGISPAGYYLKVLKTNENVLKMLQHNPFIAQGPDGLHVALFIEDRESESMSGACCIPQKLPKGVEHLVYYSVKDDGAIRYAFTKDLSALKNNNIPIG